MSTTKKPANSKEIIELSDKEHIRLRPGMYLGQVKPVEEKVLVFDEPSQTIIEQNQIYSVALYKLFDEIFSNALDEARRLKGKMLKIQVYFNTETQQVTVQDTGEGFFNGIGINPVSGLTNIEAAVSRLKAGSNFFNDETSTAIGTNGVGSAIVNIMSETFEIETKNADSHFFRRWVDFEPEETFTKTGKQKETGTRITFIPLKSTFGNWKWNKNTVWSYLIIKNWLIKNTEPEIANLQIEFFWDNKQLQLISDPFIKDRLSIDTKIGKILLWPKFEFSPKIGFINGAQGSGVYQKMVDDWVNKKMDYDKSHHLFDTTIALVLPPSLMRFNDQNKTKLGTTRAELEPLFEQFIYPKLERGFPGSSFEKKLKKLVEDIQKENAIKKIKTEKKNTKLIFSDKFLPSSRKVNIFLCEGDSAGGALAQRRNTETDAVFKLTGKIKNCNTLSDLASSPKMIELLHILDLDIENPKKKSVYEKIIIATDADCLDPNLKIQTIDGLKRLGDITYNDFIITPSGPSKIDRIQEKEHTDVITISIKGKMYLCSVNHIWPVYDSVIKQTVLKKARYINKETDYFLIKKE